MNLIVYKSDEQNGMIYPQQPPKDQSRLICPLYMIKNEESDVIPYHYIPITDIASFMNMDMFCKTCYVTYRHAGLHACKSRCSVCRGKECMEEQADQHICIDCSMICRNQSCYDAHKRRRILKNGKESTVDAPCRRYAMNVKK